MLNKLQPVYGSYAVFGNHDYFMRSKNVDKLNKLLNEQGFQTLQNENATIIVEGKKVNIIGIDDYGSSKSDVVKSYENLDRGYHLVLTHDPNIVLGYVLIIILIICYQDIFMVDKLFRPKPYHLTKWGRMGKLPEMNILKGLHYIQGKPYYISEGLGQTGMNIRFGSRPEISIHHLQILETAPHENINQSSYLKVS